MHRAAILLYGVVAYGVFFATFLYLIAFVGNLQQTDLVHWLPMLPAWVPHSIDAGREGGPIAVAVAVNLGLILLFGLQHSAMARMGFKAWLKRHLPASAERSTYVLIASLVLVLLYWQWRPIAAPLWQTTSAIAQWLAWSLFAAGFAIVLLATFLIDHFNLFGLRQVWRQFVGLDPPAAHFSTPLFYRWVRHPLYLGFIIAFWSTPLMSWGHLLFAAAMSSYILIAIRFEERDLVRHLGERYVRYREEVPMLVPATLRRRAADGPDVAGARPE